MRRSQRVPSPSLALAAVAALGVAAAEPVANDAAVWDYIVVGAGTGGALCAGRLAAGGATVLLLEAGDWDGEWLYDQKLAGKRNSEEYVWGYPTRLPPFLSVQNSEGRRHLYAAGRLMGGSSSVHGDVYDRPPFKEYEYLGLGNSPGAQVRWDGDAVREAFERIEADLSITWRGEKDLDRIPDGQYFVVDKLFWNMPLAHRPHHLIADAGNPGVKGGLSVGWLMYRTCDDEESGAVKISCRRHTSYSDFIHKRNASSTSAEASDQKSTPIDVLQGALASRIVFEGDEAVGVEIQRHGRGFEAFARRGVVLAAGALGTPKLLMLSGVGDPLELQRLGVPVRVPNREVGQNLADHLAVFTWFMLKGGDDMDLDGPVCDDKEQFNIFFNLTDPPTGGDGRLDAEVRFFSGCNRTRKTLDFGLEAVLLHPESKGRVVVPSASAEVLPMVEYPALWQHDYDRLESIVTRVGDVMGMQPKDLVPDKGMTLGSYIKKNGYLYQHFCCSARVAASSEQGVCDENLRVRGVGGLFVADASALPEPPSAHTSAPVLLLAELAAQSAAQAPARELPERTQQSSRDRLFSAAAATAAERGPGPGWRAPTVALLTHDESPPVRLPLAALGTGTLSRQRVAGAVAAFLRLGGRHLDTAAMYGNYEEVHAGIQASGLRNLSELVVTAKMMPFGRDYVRDAVAEALTGLGVHRLSVALLHWPGDVANGKLLHGRPLPACVASTADGGVSWKKCRLESYSALLEERAAGRVGAVGVSNFALKHFDELADEGHDPPAVHQMELHPLWREDELLMRHSRDGTQVEAYGCLGGAHTGAVMLRQDGFKKIGDRKGATPAQVLLRWALQHGAAVIAGGSSDAHLKENLDIFHFTLDDGDMNFMNSHPPEEMRKMYGPLPKDIL